MKNIFIWAVFAIALAACTRNDNLKNGIQVSGRITQKGSGLAVPYKAFTIDLYAEPNTYLASTMPDQNGYYVLNYGGLGHIMSSGLKIRIDQPWQAWPDINYLPSYHEEILGKGTVFKRDFEIETIAYIKARFVNRGNNPVTNLRLSYGSFEKPVPVDSNEFRMFAIEGNTNVRLWCRYSQNGVNYSDAYDYTIAGYDTLTQVVYYGLP
jgi:hypothetical protein